MGMREMDELFGRLGGSRFRARFRLGAKERKYLRSKGMETVLRHAAEMIASRLAPAEPANDGRQTPMRGHPVFVAQHATATCCRGCLAKWHGIPKGREMTDEERRHAVAAIARWLGMQHDAASPAGTADRADRADEADQADPQLGLGLD
jgi:predicted Fe-S protein YdhL (DUF1289 family)